MRMVSSAAITAAVIAAAGVGVGVGVAHAEPQSVSVRVKPRAAKSKSRASAPELEATIIGVRRLPADALTIAAVGASGAEPSPPIVATDVRGYADGPEPLALALVVDGSETWMGNDDIEPDGPSKFPGALHGLAAAIDESKLSTFAPAGSQAMIIAYSKGAEIELAMGKLARVKGAALGGQRAYHGHQTSDLTDGIHLALASLRAVKAARHVLIVIGDGNDTNRDSAKKLLASFKHVAEVDGVETFAIIYKSAFSDGGDVISGMIARTMPVDDLDGLRTALVGLVDLLADRYYVTFPGYDASRHDGLPWDGAAHDLVVNVDGVAGEPIRVTLEPAWLPPKP
jgi:hypothetical protein